MAKNYYQILEVDKSASDAEIKASYKKLAQKWHPDKNPNNKTEAENQFMAISEAYDVLKNPEKKKMYDQLGPEGFANMNQHGDPGASGHPFGFGGGMPFGFDPFSMFRDMFQKEDQVPDIEIPIKLTLEELYVGTKKKVKFERYTLCTECDAKGAIGDNIKCTDCEGRGMKINRTPIGMVQSTCNSCRGKGISPNAKKCSKCNGNGCSKEEHTLVVDIPKGANKKHPIIIENEGNDIPVDERRHNSRSNVVCIVEEQPHSKFNRGTVIKEIGKPNENNLQIELRLSLEESLCGFEKTFTHLDNKLFKFGINHNVKHGDIYVMKGYGMPYYGDDKKGDLIVKINVEERILTTEEKQKIWKVLSKEPYVEYKKQLSTIIPYTEYKQEMVNENARESMKDKYRRRKEEKNNMGGEEVQCVHQ